MSDTVLSNQPNNDLDFVKRACEAILFACGSAVTNERLAASIGVSAKDIPPALHALKEEYDARTGAVEVVLYADGAQLVTKSEYGELVRTALELRKNQPLSRAALEVLAVVAYNQPVTRAFIDKVRGVESPSVTSSLAEKGLIEEVGRLDAPGHPILYGTTAAFLRTFGLSSIEELGDLPELEEIRRAFLKDGEQLKMDIGDGRLSDESAENTEGADPSSTFIAPPKEGTLSENDDNAPQIALSDIVSPSPDELFADCEAYSGQNENK